MSSNPTVCKLEQGNPLYNAIEPTEETIYIHLPQKNVLHASRYRTMFLKRSIQGLEAYSKVKNLKVVSFLRAPEDLEGLINQKNFVFQNARIKPLTINSNCLL